MQKNNNNTKLKVFKSITIFPVLLVRSVYKISEMKTFPPSPTASKARCYEESYKYRFEKEAVVFSL